MRTRDRLRLAGLAALANLAAVYFLLWPLAKTLALVVGGAEPQELNGYPSEGRGAIVRFMSSVVVVPFLEETAFRLALLPTPWRTAAACGPLAMLLFPPVLDNGRLLLASVAAGAAIGVLFRGPLSRLLLQVGLRRLVLTQAALFALAHLPNFTGARNLVRIVPLVLPNFVSGFLLAYIRLRLGFRWAWFHHGAYNLLLMGLLW
jgi:hypothetical protein